MFKHKIYESSLLVYTTIALDVDKNTETKFETSRPAG